MKDYRISLPIAVLALFFLAGCVTGTGAPGTASAPDGSEAADDRDLSSTYHYLAARRLMAENDFGPAEIQLKKAIEKDRASAFLKRELIRLYHTQEKTGQALALAEILAADDPDTVENLLILVRLKQPEGNTPEFSALLKRILTLDPDNKETYLRLGKIYMDTDQLDPAMALFDKMIERFPDYYVAYFYRGEILLAKDQAKDAEKAFLKTLELEPELVEPRFRLIELYSKTPGKQNREKTQVLFEEILDIEPGNDRAALEMALFYLRNKETEKADELFARLGQEAKENPRLVMSAVDAFITQKRYEDAVVVFTQLRKADPGNTNLNFFTGMAHEAMGNIDQAIALYLKVTPDHPQYKKTVISIAFLYRDKKDPAQAVRFLEQHHAQSPSDIDIITYLASFYEEAKDYTKAMTLLQKGLKQSPDNPGLLFRLGALQDKAGLREDCINTMKAVIRLDPDNPSALNYLGYTYAEMGIHLDQALELIQRALAVKPGDGYITDSLGWVYYQQQAYDKAVHYLEKAAEISGYETIIAAHLGDAYLKTGQREKALQMYKKALENAKPDQDNEVLQIREKIKTLERQGNGKP